jgi:hypothetical protein
VLRHYRDRKAVWRTAVEYAPKKSDALQSFGSHCQPLGDLSIRRRARCGFAASRNTAQSREPRGGWLTANPPRPRDAVAEALDYARQRGLLHRDVKPSNLLLANPDDGQQRILLADFGIARQLADISGLTATNLTVGTVAYAAPEQLIGLDIDGRADQYALAVTAFHLLPVHRHSSIPNRSQSSVSTSIWPRLRSVINDRIWRASIGVVEGVGQGPRQAVQPVLEEYRTFRIRSLHQ